MAISKAGGKWRVSVDVGRKADGRRDRMTKIVATKGEARALEAEWLMRKEMREGVSRRCTLSQFVDLYWRPMKQSSLQQTSLDSYEQDLRLRILPALGPRDMQSITRADVQMLVSSCATESVAKRSRALLRAIFNEAVSAGVCFSNPAAGRFQMPRRPIEAPNSAEREVWLTTFDEHKRVLEAAKGAGEVEKIVLLGLCEGMRKEEILAANVRDLDFDEGTITVGSAYVQTSKGNILQPTKTPESYRTLPLFRYPRERLRILTEGMSPDEPLIQARTGKRLSPSTATKMVRRFIAKNGLPYVTAKTMRHSFASACINAGIEVPKVSKWLGHTNITTTYNRYVKAKRSDLLDAADRLDGVVGDLDAS